MTTAAQRNAKALETAKLPPMDRFKIAIVSSLGYWIIQIICSTLRWQVKNWENYESIHTAGKRIIVAFWHGRMFMSAYYFRHRGFVVMTSRNRDGEYIARVLQRNVDHLPALALLLQQHVEMNIFSSHVSSSVRGWG